MDESFLTGFLLTATTLHAVLTLLVNALREVSHSRLEQELQSPEQIETFNELLADDHDTIEDLSNLRGLSLIVAAVSLALLFVHRLEPGGDALEEIQRPRVMTVRSAAKLVGTSEAQAREYLSFLA